ncbi:hypothetical protein ACFFX0_15155 [Citricoccus parietis]|uniref:Uncharacterized protein n=1 Tax=Citricoccus parietis TaxID=592307 RepID=A0ABV5G0M9_9MICC
MEKLVPVTVNSPPAAGTSVAVSSGGTAGAGSAYVIGVMEFCEGSARP